MGDGVGIPAGTTSIERQLRLPPGAGRLTYDERARGCAARRSAWRNLFRRSDSNFGGIFGNDASDPVDELLIDPAFAKPPGDIAHPPPLGRSHYPDDPARPGLVSKVKDL